MSAEIINLRKARKAKARKGDEAQAAQNRVIFGEASALKKARKAEMARAGKSLDAGRIIAPNSVKAAPETGESK